MAYYWVNQGGTFREEVAGECLWAPERTETGARLRHWDTLDELKAGDLVFSYAKAYLRGFARVRSTAVPCPRPYDAGKRYLPGQGGRIVFCEYQILESDLKIHKKTLLADSELLDEFNSGSDRVLARNEHISFEGSFRIAQKYLSHLSARAGQILSRRLIDRGLNVPLGRSADARRLDSVTVRRLIEARVGQGRFRSDLLETFGSSCALTGLARPELLRASHIVPWALSSTTEKLDPNNGLLLGAGLDAAFDAGLVTFAADGTLLSKLSDQELQAIGVARSASIRRGHLTAERVEYLRRHRAQAGM